MDNKCFICGSEKIIWESDFDTEDYGIEEEGIVHCFRCGDCDAEYLVIEVSKNE